MSRAATGGERRTGIEVLPVEGIAEVRPGDDLAGLLAEAAGDMRDGDVVVVTQKVVSKAEAQLVPIDPNDPESKAKIVEAESVRVLRRRGDLIISETRHGFVCANAGIDLSNVDDGYAALLPVDSDRSAHGIRQSITAAIGVGVAVVVSDTFGRAWRHGLTDVAIGVAGLAAVVDLRGETDALGRELHVTEVALADEVAGAAELVMGKSKAVPVAIVRGLEPTWFRDGSVNELLRAPKDDLFR